MTAPRRSFWFWATAALAAGTLLRLWFIHHMSLVAGDSFLYGDLAKNLIWHGSYAFTEPGSASGTTQLRSTLIRLPGYPLFLAACFRIFGMENYRAIMYVQLFSDLLTCALAAATARHLFGRRACLAVLWIACLCPFTANYVATPLTETLVLTTIALAFYASLQWQVEGLGLNRWLWILAVALACSLLLRPDQGLLAVALLPAVLWRSYKSRPPHTSVLRSAVPALAAGLCTLLPLAPWTLRNWHTFHVFQPLAPVYANDPGELVPTGFGRWYRSWAIEFISTEDVYWNYMGGQIDIADLPARALTADSPAASASLRLQTARLLSDYNQTTVATPAIDARFAALATERIHAHPLLYYVGLPLARVADMLLRPRTEMLPVALDWWRFHDHLRQSAFALAYAAVDAAYLAAGLLGFYLWKRVCNTRHARMPELAVTMAAFLILRCLLLLKLDNSEPRYTLEFFPVVFVWAGALFARSHPEQPSLSPTSAETAAARSE